MYQIYAVGQEKPNGHVYSGWGGLNRTYESDLRYYLVFEATDFEPESEEMITFIYGVYVRTPPIGNFEYSPFGDVNWSEWEEETEDLNKWHERALEVAKPASEMQAEFERLLGEGYALYCNL